MVERIGVVGCGQMGLGIVEVATTAGLDVVAVRASGGDPTAARERFEGALDRRVAKGKLTADARDAALSRAVFSESLSDLGGCDLVIESAAEDLALKLALLPRIEAELTSGAVLATNTSSLPLPRLAAVLNRPHQFLAMHFFNPVPAMELVELAGTTETAPGALETARTLCGLTGKTAVDVSPSAGYVVNRLLVPYLLHAIESLESGIADAEAIDAAMKLGCGHPMGPLALSDLIGLDVVYAMATTLHAELHDSRYRPPSLLRRLVNAGHLGRKSKRGIYDYATKPATVNPAIRLSPIEAPAEAAE